MRIKTNELSGAALDWAVAEASGTPIYRSWKTLTRMDMDGQHYWQPSIDWAQGGPIIEREGITIFQTGRDWMGYIRHDTESFAPTPLIAAMRCYVASKLGDDIDIPEELTP